METLTQYVETHSRKKPGQDIEQRWQQRVVAMGMHGLGGAERYLDSYGKNIGPAKVCLLALRAEMDHDQAMANVFWQEAYRLEHGTPPPITAGRDPVPATERAPVQTPELIVGLPATLQPGRVVTMQPTDATFGREFYINNPDYFGQPKYDGNRMLVFAGSDGTVAYQMRTMAVRASQNKAIHDAFSTWAKHDGAFVLDGEWWWEDCLGAEHRTAAQAAATDVQLREPDIRPIPHYSVFAALCLRGMDLTEFSATTRANMGHAIAEQLHLICPGILPVLTAYATEDKRILTSEQLNENREGEVWYYKHAPYTGGKTPGENIVRTKYTVEFDAIVTDLLPSNKADRPFSAIQVALRDKAGALVPIGSVGTGFTQDEMERILNLYQHLPKDNLTIKVKSRRFTEFGKVWHASYEGISTTPAAQCLLEQIQ